jgi:cysteine desulfurase
MVVYLDHASTTPIRPQVLTRYTEFLQVLGNPSSVHSAGQGARQGLEEAREELATALGANRSEVVFTAGGTESDNLAIKGLFWQRNKDAARPLIVSAYTEHHAVIDPIEWLEKEHGAQAVWVPVDSRGVVDLNWLKDFVDQNAQQIALISLMWANNETGVVTPVQEVVKIAKPFDIPVHSDAIAAVGHIDVDFAKSGLTAMSLSGHKVGAPVGLGALLVARSAKLTSLTHGGGQERSLRAGTMNAAGAKALSLAVSMAVQNLPNHKAHTEALRDRLVAGVEAAVAGATFSRADAPGLPNSAHFTFDGCSGDSLLFLLDQAGICVSNGSACTAGVASASHVLMAMGRTEVEASGCIRVSFGDTTTVEDIDAFLRELPKAHLAARRAGLTSS